MTLILLAVIYLAFISLGLPDALLGAAWPSIYPAFDVPVSSMGAISMIISIGTVISSLQSDRMTRRFGTGKVTAVSVAMTCAALFGFSMSHAFWQLCLWAVPLGLGAGSVDASLNNYVALHYASRHMSWLHCMWGLGASIGPYIMGAVLTRGAVWGDGYRIVAFIQLALTIGLFLSLRLWKTHAGKDQAGEASSARALRLREIIAISGAKEIMVCFFCYCALEQTAGLWAGSYFVLHGGLSEEVAARLSSMFYIGITAGRALSGFMTLRFSDRQMVRIGQGVILLGVLALFLPLQGEARAIGLVLIGLGCAPIYPCIIHSTPDTFGAENSQAVIGVQMATAYIGICTMPPLFGIIARNISAGLLPVFLLVILIGMFLTHEGVYRRRRGEGGA